MIRFLRYIAFLVVSVAVGQTSNPELEVKKTIDTFFEGFHKGDTILMKSVLSDKIVLQTAVKDRQGKDKLLTEELKELTLAIGNRPADQKWDERLLDYKIQVDGNMAHAWTPYEFWFNGQFSHCGVNSFQLFQEDGDWKIIYLIDTRRKQGCRD
ncbi:nuclear transport factor 2 family protein [Mangrovimonas sp. AS39]|uniref:nuclear transport factor 2 family protein n=1 Tax=Mangrovimonas futianensis TaxID=2895523 RepID=UPI001E602ACE|nr:nuclear transport factor 2 family protein [Mangrovimonas futianensis]MCF1192786.1 nuclear transport factor 2 family protein [Mangrovimonas futianensis]MCF1196296.1 nuclear transport factor 2 family protein [Mangrovimonas futianensis]